MAKIHFILAVTAVVMLQCQFCFAQTPAGSPQTGDMSTSDMMASLASSCPLKEQDFAATDYAPVKTACDTTTLSGQGFCSSCICAVGSALVIGFEKAGVLINGQRVSDLASSTDPAGTGAVDMLMANCSTLLGLQLLESGALTPAALTELGDCQVAATTLQCSGTLAAPASTPSTSTTPAKQDLTSSAAAPAAAPATAPAKSWAAASAAHAVVAIAAALAAAVLVA